MADGYSTTDLLDFLEHAADRGLMPAATARSFAVAARNVFAVLPDAELADVRSLDLDALMRRFTNKRARDFTPESLREYGRRVKRAVALFVSWRDDPANFKVPTRATNGGSKQKSRAAASAQASQQPSPIPADGAEYNAWVDALTQSARAGYQTAFPLRAGHLVTLANIPDDLSADEAERLAQFVRMLVPKS